MDWTLLIRERLVVTHREHPSGNVSVRGKPCSPSCLSVRALVSGSQSHLLLKTKISTTHYKSVCVCCIGLYYTYFSACLLSYIIELQIYTYFLPNWDAPVLRNKSWAVECVTQHAGNSVEGRDVYSDCSYCQDLGQNMLLRYLLWCNLKSTLQTPNHICVGDVREGNA